MVSRRPRPWPGASVGTLGSATTAPSNDLGTASPLPAAIDGRDGVRGGSPTSGKRRRGRDTADAVRRAAAGDGHRPAAGDASDVGAASAEVPDAETMGASAAAEVASDAGALELDLRSEVASAGPNAADAGEGFGGAAVGAAENDAVREGGGAEADGEPDGSGGDPRSPAVPAGGQAAPADPEPAPAPVASQREISVEGLGLADLLAGALAAYRAI